MSDSIVFLIRVVGGALPLAIALALWTYVRRRRRVAARLGDPSLVAGLAGGDLTTVPRLRMLTILLAAVLLGAAMTDPRWGEASAREQASAGRVVLVLDASSSMLAEDLAPNRLERQRAAANELARRLPEAAMAVVMFAGRAYALVPPTTDRGALDLYLRSLDPSMVTQTGSSLTAAIRQGLGLLAAGDQAGALSGALVLMSDGDTVDDQPQVQEVVALARRAGIPIFTLGAGTTAGAPVPDIDLSTGERSGFKRAPSGELAVSRLNEALLQQIAEGSGGAYASLADPDAVGRIVDQLRTRGSEAPGSPQDVPPQFGWFAGLALLLLCLDYASQVKREQERR